MALSLAISGLLASTVSSTPLYKQLLKRDPTGPVLTQGFADPCFIQTNESTTYYGYGTTNEDFLIPLATSPDFATWTYAGKDALAAAPSWGTAPIWAPDVFLISTGDFAGWYNMYYAAQVDSGGTHCLGLARSSKANGAAGPYADNSASSWICPSDQGGAIDPAAFVDSDGSRYIVYKIDGDHVGSTSTPIMVQQVDQDGYTLIGGPTQIYDNEGADSPDFGNAEAPALVKGADGTYYLFFSHGSTFDTTYAEAVVTATSLLGPYGNRQEVLNSTEYGLLSPGGLDINDAGGKAVFHNGTVPSGRLMFTAQLSLNNGVVTVQ